MVEPSKQEYDGGEFLLKYAGGWRVIWSVTGGGTDDCGAAADYYRSALALLTSEGVDPDLLNPQLQEEYLRLKTLAAEDPDCSAVGDLGPELAAIPAKRPCSSCGADASPALVQDRSRIVKHSRFPAPITGVDLDGDGKPDTVAIVQILPGAGRVVAPDVMVANPWDTDGPAQALPGEEQPMALLVENSRSGTRHLLHSPYVELSAGIRGGTPVEARQATSRLAGAFRKDCPAMRHDFLLMATEAGIDIALFWNAGHYEVCWPDEIP